MKIYYKNYNKRTYFIKIFNKKLIKKQNSKSNKVMVKKDIKKHNKFTKI